MSDLDYVAWLLERLVYLQSPTTQEFDAFRSQILKEQYNASRIESPAALHGDVRARSCTCQRQVPADDAGAIPRVRLDPKQGITSPFTEKEDDQTLWQNLTPTPPLDKAEDLPQSKQALKPAEHPTRLPWRRR